MSLTRQQDFFRQNLTQDIPAGTCNIYMAVTPTASAGWLVINPGSTILREIVYYTSKGTDITGNYVVISSATTGRGLGGTTNQIHYAQEPIRINWTAEAVQEISDALDGIVAGGAQDASIVTKGISKLSVAPVLAGTPIAVGDNDPRLPTQTENDALLGTNGTPSSSNKYVTSLDPRLGGGEQDIAYYTGSNTNFTTSSVICTDVSGTVMFIGYGYGSSVTIGIVRLQKDTSTGQWYTTHTTTITTGSGSSGIAGMCVIGTYLYVVHYNAAVNKINRYLAADLTGVTAMTLVGTSRGSICFTDGTNLYMNYTTNTVAKFTISGTTATNASDITFTGMSANSSPACDGTYVWATNIASGNLAINKWALTGGTAISTSSTILLFMADPNPSYPNLLVLGSGKMGVAYSHSSESNTAMIGGKIKLISISLP